MFINYRGEDSHSYGALLYTELVRQFGDERVFLDCESIPAGADFVEELLYRVRSARVLLAVIGPRWLTATDATGRRRIDDPADWIRRELAAAFAAGVRVIPVLTEQHEIPAAADLPADIAALSRCQYRRLRHHNPTADLARIVTDLTRLDHTLPASARGRSDVPRQLPAAPRLFTGRATELAALTDATAPTSDERSAVVIGGSGGIGKTALALRWAYRHLHRFPDGQLYVNLRGFDPSGQPTPAGEAVRGFLDALGVEPATMPADLDAQTARYRSLVAGRRMLIVLDNARDVDQVFPLLPGSSTCTVLVSSRRHLAGLATRHGACLLDLDVLPESDARELLARILGPRRLADEPQAVVDLLAVCAGLPLALRIVAARAEHHLDFPIAVLAEELLDAGARLDGLDAGDPHTNLGVVLSWSVRALHTLAANMFGLLGIAPGRDISLSAAASLVALSTGRARVVLRELENASLVQQHQPGRYRMHDLVRLYATDTASRHLPNDLREAALRRVLDFYTHSAHTADQLLDPHRDLLRPNSLAPGVHVHSDPLSDVTAALTWFDTEHACLLAAQQAATTRQWHSTVWHLAWALSTFHIRRGHRHDQLTVWRAAADAAAHLPDPTTRIRTHRALGRAHADLGRHDDAIEHLQQALAGAEHNQELIHQAHTHQALVLAWERRGDDRQALDHARRARDLYRVLGQPVLEAHALNAVGWFAARSGEHDGARDHCQAALALYRDHDNPSGEASALDSLGWIDQHSGHHHQAIDHYRHALTLYHNSGSTNQIANTLDRLGHPHAALGQHEQARTVWQEALALYQRMGRDTDEVRVRRQLDNLSTATDE